MAGSAPVADAVSPQDPSREDEAREDAVRVHDAYTFSALDYAQIGALKRRAAKLGVSGKKNALLRAGIAELARLSDAQLRVLLDDGGTPPRTRQP